VGEQRAVASRPHCHVQAIEKSSKSRPLAWMTGCHPIAKIENKGEFALCVRGLVEERRE
jgi:hypothetical protein